MENAIQAIKTIRERHDISVRELLALVHAAHMDARNAATSAWADLEVERLACGTTDEQPLPPE